jgi:peptidoglycan/LPS O-acetylase OafA/YrhL
MIGLARSPDAAGAPVETTIEETVDRSHRFAVLDSLRGVSAMLIAVLHFEGAWHLYDGRGTFSNLHFLVDFFFVLSGFVICYSYANRIATADDAWRFAVRRFGRLWPLHAAMFLVFFALECAKAITTSLIGRMQVHTAFTGPTAPHTMVTNLLLMNSFGLEKTPTWNEPSWSIGAEFYTYLVFAAVCLVPKVPRALLALAVALFGAAVIAAWSPDFMAASSDYGFYRCLFGFFTGVAVYFAFARGRRPGMAGTAVEIAVIAMACLFLLLTGSNASSLLAPLVFGLCVYVFAHEDGAVSRLLLRRPFRNLGLWSYSIYMVHLLVFMILIYAPARFAEKLAGLDLSKRNVAIAPKNVIVIGGPYVMDALLLVYLCLVVFLAALSYRWIEAPGRSWFRELSRAKSFRKTA